MESLIQKVYSANIALLESTFLSFAVSSITEHGHITTGRCIKIGHTCGMSKFVGSDIVKIHPARFTRNRPIKINIIINLVPLNYLTSRNISAPETPNSSYGNHTGGCDIGKIYFINIIECVCKL